MRTLFSLKASAVAIATLMLLSLGPVASASAAGGASLAPAVRQFIASAPANARVSPASGTRPSRLSVSAANISR